MFEFKMLGLIVSMLTTDPIQETQLRVDDIKSKPAPQIQPVPKFTNDTVAHYNAGKHRNPFLSFAMNLELSKHVVKKVVVDSNRKKQPLEAYPISELVMTGVIKKGKNLDVMIRTPDGHLSVAAIGDYIGENHGRVRKVTHESVDIAEAVDDGRGGYVERSRVLFLLENTKTDGI